MVLLGLLLPVSVQLCLDMLWRALIVTCLFAGLVRSVSSFVSMGMPGVGCALGREPAVMMPPRLVFRSRILERCILAKPRLALRSLRT